MSRPAIVIVALALGALATLAHAQDGGVADVQVRWERPAEGTLDRGVLGVPAWTVIGVGGVVVISAAIALVGSIRRGRRGAR